jgi:hypothetical protein
MQLAELQLTLGEGAVFAFPLTLGAIRGGEMGLYARV